MFWLTFISVFIVCFTYTTSAFAANPTVGRLPPPRLDQDTWVMIEIWPDVQAITLFRLLFRRIVREEPQSLRGNKACL